MYYTIQVKLTFDVNKCKNADLNFLCSFLFCFDDRIVYPFVVVVQSLSYALLFAMLWTALHQAFLSFTIFLSLLKLVSIVLMILSNHLILLLSIFIHLADIYCVSIMVRNNVLSLIVFVLYVIIHFLISF